METLTIDILNPKARNILNDLEDLNLIKINFERTTNEFQNLLIKLRSKSLDAPSDEEMISEVKTVRKLRNAN